MGSALDQLAGDGDGVYGRLLERRFVDSVKGFSFEEGTLCLYEDAALIQQMSFFFKIIDDFECWVGINRSLFTYVGFNCKRLQFWIYLRVFSQLYIPEVEYNWETDLWPFI